MAFPGWQHKKVLVTGAGSGIGKAATLAFLRSGSYVTAVDVSAAGLDALKQECGQQHAGKLLTVACDLCDDAAQVDVFQAHHKQWGVLDCALINAGIGETGKVLADDDVTKWQPTLDLDLRASIVGIQLAARSMIKANRPGTIISIASAAGVYPHPAAPVYCAAKAGLIHFTKSVAATLAKKNVHIGTICPQFVDTALVANSTEGFKRDIAVNFGKLMTPEIIVEEIVKLAQDPKRSGAAAVILQNGMRFDWDPPPTAQKKSKAKQGAVGTSMHVPQQQWFAPGPIPKAYLAWQVTKLTHNFAEAVELRTLDTPQVVPADSVLIKRVVTGVNASDVNFTSGTYQGSPAAAKALLPFTAGFESVGVVCKAGTSSGLREGQAVATLTYGGFSEYALEKARFVVPVHAPTAEVVAFMTSGLTASIALEEAKLVKGQTALVTAAAGGTGLFAVQLAKLAGMHVIGTCGSADKAAVLRALGVDRVVNYKQEDLKQVLKAEYRKGVDVVYESVGGQMFKTAVDAVAFKGRLVVIGMMSQYSDGWPVDAHPGLPEKLLKKSASLIGFFLPAYANRYKAHLARLISLHTQGHLKVVIDKRPFTGIHAVPAAVQHLQSGQSFGKVVVHIGSPGSAISKL